MWILPARSFVGEEPGYVVMKLSLPNVAMPAFLVVVVLSSQMERVRAPRTGLSKAPSCNHCWSA